KSLNVTPSADQPGPAAGATIALPTDLIPTQVVGALLQRQAPTPDPDASWNPVLEVSGNESLRSSPFKLNGGTVKLHYNVTAAEGNATALLAVYLTPEGTPTNQGGIPDVFAAVGDGEQLLARPPGSYILNSECVGGSWAVG